MKPGNTVLFSILKKEKIKDQIKNQKAIIQRHSFKIT